MIVIHKTTLFEKLKEIFEPSKKFWLSKIFENCRTKLNINHLEAIMYLVKTGCQWSNLPAYYGPYTSGYYYFRAHGECGMLNKILRKAYQWVRKRKQCRQAPTVAVIDSQSVRSALPQSEKGIDGNKRIKGIKRQIAVDSQGLPLAVHVTTANIHDSKGAIPLMVTLYQQYPAVTLVKADNGYKGKLQKTVLQYLGAHLECIKSNHGTSDFISLKGRWVVERTISWLENYRRLCRNYEKLLKTAKYMCLLSLIAIFMKRME